MPAARLAWQKNKETMALSFDQWKGKKSRHLNSKQSKMSEVEKNAAVFAFFEIAWY